MKIKKVTPAVFLTCLILFLAFSGCSNNDPAVIYDPNDPGASTPQISQVEPPDAALGGVTKVKILGSNFSPQIDQNTVFFGTNQGDLIAASTTELTVVPPNMVGDSLTIKVVVRDAYLTAEYGPYKLEPVVIKYGKFLNVPRLRSLAMDAAENLYVAPAREVLQVTPLQAEIPYATLPFVTAVSMRWGPGGYLYIQRINNDRLYRVPPGGGEAQEFIRFPEIVFFFDFDENLNIYSGGNEGFYVLRNDSTVVTTGQYLDVSIKAVRVFNGHVYVAAMGDPQSGIWRNQILDTNGSISDRELYFDWANAGEFSESEITDITFSEDGDLYVGAARDLLDSILIIHPDGTSEILYPGVLLFPVENFVWGNDQFLYVNHANIDLGISRISMDKEGAPYYGRRQ